MRFLCGSLATNLKGLPTVFLKSSSLCVLDADAPLSLSLLRVFGVTWRVVYGGGDEVNIVCHGDGEHLYSVSLTELMVIFGKSDYVCLGRFRHSHTSRFIHILYR